MVCYIGVVDELDRLATSPLGSIADPLSWELSLLLKRRFPFPLVLGRGWYIYGGWNDSFWMVRRVVRALWRVVCYLRRELVFYYFQFI